jgi:hypothetical protein
LDSVPAILLIDPITGQKMRGWNGMVYPDSLLEVFSNPVFYLTLLCSDRLAVASNENVNVQVLD